ncbi:predicted protein [Naegleria gruberi]|uniref:Predicted protein n=1 Tax=Naegleria gruberi TaxID=5762 RepID=D2W371_NAEGR|nr:uncharacterized protein NAEGRDRAFT_75842 [Naegleria gruberi]EFC36437.1 predicted protein [Naegleria gruberi]|eukprot:XP_002669181.1 predicted protein [Naegleria gruberi strain NEG-M]
MPAKQKSKKSSKHQELSDSDVQDSDYEEQRTTRSSKRLSNKTLANIAKQTKLVKALAEKKPKKQRKFLSLSEEAKISAVNAKLLTFIVGKKNPISRSEMTARAKQYLTSDEEFNGLKITIAALNSISLVMNHRFGALFNIASILASYKESQTVTALELEFAKKILDGKLSSINANANDFVKMFCDYRNKDTPIKNPDPQFADKLFSAIQKEVQLVQSTTKDIPSQADITTIFSDKAAIKRIDHELKMYKKTILE